MQYRTSSSKIASYIVQTFSRNHRVHVNILPFTAYDTNYTYIHTHIHGVLKYYKKNNTFCRTVAKHKNCPKNNQRIRRIVSTSPLKSWHCRPRHSSQGCAVFHVVLIWIWSFHNECPAQVNILRDCELPNFLPSTPKQFKPGIVRRRWTTKGSYIEPPSPSIRSILSPRRSDPRDAQLTRVYNAQNSF